MARAARLAGRYGEFGVEEQELTEQLHGGEVRRGAHTSVRRDGPRRRDEGDAVIDSTPLPVMGLEVEGNFLFDPVEPHDMRKAILAIETNHGGLEEGALGDLWIRGDRGAQLLCTPEAATQLHGRQSYVRDVEIQLEQRPLHGLQLPAIRTPKRFTSVEASCRLDAIASAGFGLARAKVVQQIRNGRLRLHW